MQQERSLTLPEKGRYHFCTSFHSCCLWGGWLSLVLTWWRPWELLQTTGISLNSSSVKRLWLLSMLSMVTPAGNSSAPLAPATPRSLQILPKKQTLKANAPPCSCEVKIVPTASAAPIHLQLTSWRSCLKFWGVCSQEYKHYFEVICAFFWFAGLHFLKHAQFVLVLCPLFHYSEMGILSI